MNRFYILVAECAGFRCEYCHAPQQAFNFPFEVEHIQPVSADGTDEESNLALACRACNAFKADRREGSDPQTGQTAPLFHPRTDIWAAHFVVDEENMEVRGVTATGRATVQTLRMNEPAQILARRQWRRLGLFP